MNKYDKYVYLTICEISLDCFKKSKFISYTNYCRNFGINLRLGDLSKEQMKDLIRIGNYVDEILSMDDSSIAGYLVDFFGSDVISEFKICQIIRININTKTILSFYF
jgi:hypothetical protein